MSEVPTFFETDDGSRIFGVLYEPSGPVRRVGFLLVHPLAEEKLWAQRVFVSFARELARLGFPVLRFDFRGEGDSEGNFEDSSLTTRLEDARRAIGMLMERFPDLEGVGLVGLRFGATIAALLAEEHPLVRHLVLWDPTVDAGKFFHEVLRINISTQAAVYKEIRFKREDLIAQMAAGKTVNVDGYQLGYDLYQEASSINLLLRQRYFPGPCLIVQIDKAKAPLRKELEELRSRFPEGRFARAPEEPFWKEIKVFYNSAEALTRVTLEWLREADPG
jgi:alpha/beta superfamily hydrolase